MTKIPLLTPSFPSHRLPPLPQISSSLSLGAAPAVRFRIMAARDSSIGVEAGVGGGTEAVAAGGYPKPLSSPYPPASRDVELSRAEAAVARTAAYGISEKEIVFEDEWIVVANKPGGIYCEALLTSLAARSGTETIQLDLHLANRLDRDTSGLMVITKSHKVASKFVKAFTNHMVKKTYLAFCVGHAPSWEKITINSGHGRSKFGAWRVYSTSDVGRTLPGGSMVKQMATSFEVLSINGQGKYREPEQFDNENIESIIVQEKGSEWRRDDGDKCDEVLIRAFPQSGRTHQIRLHCQYLGIPIKGDVKYGGVIDWNGVVCDGHALHAESLSFKHPMTGLHVKFHAPLPSWMNEIQTQPESGP